MSTKHTPGPWNRGYGNFIYEGKFDRTVQQRLIAVCEPTNKTREDWEEVFSNASLIAAAPDMLDALKIARYELSSCQAAIHLRGGFAPAYVKGAQAALKVIDAAIAKAAGTLVEEAA